MSPPISQINSSIPGESLLSEDDVEVKANDTPLRASPQLRVLHTPELFELILDEIDQRQTYENLLWVSKAFVPAIMRRMCGVMNWDHVARAKRSNYWLSCGLDAVQTVVCTYDGSDTSKRKPSDITGCMIDDLFGKCSNLRQVRAIHNGFDKGYSFATDEKVWEVDRNTRSRTISVHERKFASLQEILSSKTSMSLAPPENMPGWAMSFTYGLQLHHDGGAYLAHRLGTASSLLDPRINSVYIRHIRVELDDLARLVVARQVDAASDTATLPISHVQACRVMAYDIGQFTVFAEAVGSSLKVLQLRDWDETRLFPPAWGMNRPGITLVDLGDMVDAIHDNLTSLQAISFVMGASRNDTSIMIPDNEVRLSSRPYLSCDRALRKVDVTFSECFGGDPASHYARLPMLAIARNLACIADERTKVTLRCVTSQGPCRLLPEQSKLVARLIKYFRTLSPLQLEHVRFADLSELDIWSSDSKQIFRLIYDEHGRPMSLVVRAALDLLKSTHNAWIHTRDRTLKLLETAETARSPLHQAEADLTTRGYPFERPKWPFDEAWRQRVIGFVSSKEQEDLDRLKEEKEALLADIQQLKMEKEQCRAELETVKEEITMMKGEKEKLVDGLRVFR